MLAILIKEHVRVHAKAHILVVHICNYNYCKCAVLGVHIETLIAHPVNCVHFIFGARTCTNFWLGELATMDA